jgi:hypothetical protein
MQVSAGDQIRVTAGFRAGKNVFKNNDIVEVREFTDTELVLNDGRRMHRNGARIDQGVYITSHASQCHTVDQVLDGISFRPRNLLRRLTDIAIGVRLALRARAGLPAEQIRAR